MHKSEMVPIGEVVDVHALAEILGRRVGTLPMSYLGKPFGEQKPLGEFLFLFGV